MKTLAQLQQREEAVNDHKMKCNAPTELTEKRLFDRVHECVGQCGYMIALVAKQTNFPTAKCHTDL